MGESEKHDLVPVAPRLHPPPSSPIRPDRRDAKHEATTGGAHTRLRPTPRFWKASIPWFPRTIENDTGPPAGLSWAELSWAELSLRHLHVSPSTTRLHPTRTCQDYPSPWLPSTEISHTFLSRAAELLTGGRHTQSSVSMRPKASVSAQKPPTPLRPAHEQASDSTAPPPAGESRSRIPSS